MARAERERESQRLHCDRKGARWDLGIGKASKAGLGGDDDETVLESCTAGLYLAVGSGLIPLLSLSTVTSTPRQSSRALDLSSFDSNLLREISFRLRITQAEDASQARTAHNSSFFSNS